MNDRMIPQEMKELRQWVGFFREKRQNGKTTKKPVDPHTLTGASSTDPQTWGNFEEALSCIGKECFAGGSKGVAEGVGFVFAPPYCGIDLDSVIDISTGEVHPDALDIVETMDSYTEISPSGKGLHIIYKGSVHDDWKCKRGKVFGDNTDLEMYQKGRYFTVTGNVFGEHTEIREGDKLAELIQKTYMKPPKTEPSVKPEPVTPTSESKPRRALTKSDDEILTLARNSKNGLLFSELFSGNWQGRYASQSEADMAFCLLLAFWFQKDTAKMDSIYRRSGLMRDKWDRAQSGSTYGAITLQRAADECREVYQPSACFDDADGEFSITIKKQQYYSFDDTGNAERMIDLFGDKIRYYYNESKWLIYRGGKWQADIDGTIWKLISRSVEEMTKEENHYEEYDEQNGTEMHKAFCKHLKKSRSNAAKRAAERETQHHVGITPAALDRYRELLNTPNGIIDLKTFEVTKNDPEKYMTKSTSYGYDRQAECPLWLQFLDDVFGGDQELIRYIQKAVGYSLTGLTDEQCAFFCYGTGRNGKSTFIDVIRIILGDYSVNIQPETIMVRNQNSTANSDIARLKGARFVTGVEPNEGVRLNEGLLKQLTGDDIVTARKLFCEEFEFKPEFKLWMSTNHKPIIRGTDTGIWRRIHLIPFTVQIPENKVDKKLKDKLLKEAEGIFSWCIEGLKQYQKEGLQKPQAVRQALDDYRQEMDTISRFLDECTVPAPCKSIKASELYQVYTSWCDHNGEYKLTGTKFGNEVKKKYERKRTNIGNEYCGIDFSEDYRPYSVTVQ